jgi:hypothetical protein
MIRKNKFLSILMMSIIALSLSFGFSISIPVVIAGTSVVASTYTKLSISISESEDKVLRLIPKYEVYTPDLGFGANAKATTVVNNSGPATIEQKYVAWAERNGPKVNGGGAVSNAFSATNAKKVESNMSCETEVKKGKNVVHTSVSGISLANIDPVEDEQADYVFGLSGSHITKTDALYPGVGSNAIEEFERIRISFEAYPFESNIPADINQHTNLVYNIEDGVLNGYGFDYFSEVAANDITCIASMSYKKVGGD